MVSPTHVYIQGLHVSHYSLYCRAAPQIGLIDCDNKNTGEVMTNQWDKERIGSNGTTQSLMLGVH